MTNIPQINFQDWFNYHIYRIIT